MMFRMKAPSNVNHPMAGLSFVALPNSRRQASRRFYPTPHRHLAEASEHRTIPVASERHSFGGGVFQESPDLSENTGEFVQAKVQQLTVAHLLQPAGSEPMLGPELPKAGRSRTRPGYSKGEREKLPAAPHLHRRRLPIFLHCGGEVALA
jgi:hypothetical protein